MNRSQMLTHQHYTRLGYIVPGAVPPTRVFVQGQPGERLAGREIQNADGTWLVTDSFVCASEAAAWEKAETLWTKEVDAMRPVMAGTAAPVLSEGKPNGG
jgi:hypothetical protein